MKDFHQPINTTINGNRSSTIRILLLALGMMLTVVLLIPGTPARAEMSGTDADGITEGYMDWGYKLSWRNYIGASGVELSDGASLNSDGTYRFPITSGSYDSETGATELKFGGAVQFESWCGVYAEFPEYCALNTVFKDFSLTISRDEQTLYAHVVAIPRGGTGEAPPIDFGIIALAQLAVDQAEVEVTDDTTIWSGIRATVADGDAVAATDYASGTGLDDIVFQYSGQGGKPDFGEHWDTSGMPVYRSAKSWYQTDDQRAFGQLFISEAGVVHALRAFNSAGRTAYQLTAIDGATMTAMSDDGALTLSDLKSVTFAYDDKNDVLFYVLDHQGEDGLENWVYGAKWNSGEQEYQVAKVGEIGSDTVVDGFGVYAYPFSSIVWNEARQQLMVIGGYGPGTTKPYPRPAEPKLYTFSQSDHSGWISDAPIALPTAHDVSDQWEGATANNLTRYYGSAPRESLAALADGSLIVARSQRVTIKNEDGTRTQTALPVLHISLDGSEARVVEIGNSLTAESFGFENVVAAPEGGAILWSFTAAAKGLKFASVSEGNVSLSEELQTDFTMLGKVRSAEDLGLSFGYDYGAGAIMVYEGEKKIGTVSADGSYASTVYPDQYFGVSPSGSLYYQIADSDYNIGIQKLDFVGLVPTVTEQPESLRVVVPQGESHTNAEFSISLKATPEATVQWQAKTNSESTFTDIPDANTQSLRIAASRTDDGTSYRAVVSNDAGAVATDPAVLTVEASPQIITQPVSVPTRLGATGISFGVEGDGNPAPAVTWQQERDGEWTDITSEDDVYEIAGSRLTVLEVTADNANAYYRAVLTNAHGTSISDAAQLTVIDAPAEDTTFTGVTLDWTGSVEMQHQPPNGSAANYFSAGVSDGTESTYAATSDSVQILQRDGSGAEAEASYATRGLHVDRGGKAQQVLRLSDGTAEVRADGSATVTWPEAAFSVNFYDGLLPFTMSNLRLDVSESGTGTLVADLAGYWADMEHPDAGKTPVAPVSDVTVATFKNVVVDTENGFVVTPDYAGVQVEVGSEATAQKRDGSGWGAWPQPFIDFHLTTALAGYFYTTGGIFDVNKAPTAFAVGFEGATPVVPPTPEPEPEPNPTPTPKPKPPVASATESGYLSWGVRGSFRSYVAGPTAKGSISLSNGASSDGGAYRFYQTGASYNSDNGTGNASYGGAVNFRGHSGVLNVTLSDPSIVINSASSATLYMNANGSRIPIGNVNLAGAGRTEITGGVAYSGAPVTLTASGAGVFSYGSSQFYAPGTVMDPVSFVVGANAAAGSGGGGGGTVAAYQSSDWTAPAEPPATDGLWIDPESLKNLRPGTELTVYGEGFDPNEEDIKVVLYSDPIVLKENLTADAEGTAKWTGLLPTDIAPGKHTLTFQGSQNLGIELTVLEAEDAKGCSVEDATLSWGFKESFRSYISGSIAHGDWQVSDGATYETPLFAWNSGMGVFDADSFTGEVKFAGKISFTGHDGLLNTTVENPTLVFTGPEKAYLLLDVSGVTMEDAMAGNTDNVLEFEQVSFVELDLSAGDVQVSDDGVTITASDVPTTITSQGYEAFPNYEAGTEFDPVSFEIVTNTECGAEALTAISAETDEADETSSDSGAPVWPWLVGGGALAVLIVAGLTVWLVRRNRAGSDGDGDASAESNVEELLSGGGQ